MERDPSSPNLVEIRDLRIDYPLKRYTLRAVNRVDLDLRRGEITALVGESGSGKTTLATALIDCLSEPGVIAGGSVTFFGKEGTVDVAGLDENALNAFRWKRISMVFQGAQSSLNPIYTVFEQFLETMQAHDRAVTREQALAESRHFLEFVNLDPDRVLAAYPHELSGGMKQRVMIAFSLLLHPELILLDEPTTALDVITQDFIFRLLQRINREMGVAMLLLTHDISVVARYADRMGVMYGGRIMEFGSVEEIFGQRLHPYSAGLIAATPSLLRPLSDMKPIEGNPPDLLDLPSGCVFHPRCAFCMEVCRRVDPAPTTVSPGHIVRCHLYPDRGEGGRDA